MKVQRLISKEVNRCYNECPYYHFSAFQKPQCTCDHPSAEDDGDIIDTSFVFGFPKKCPIKKSSPSEIGVKTKRFDCSENENHMLLRYEDGELDCILVGDELERSWTVIGITDLTRCLDENGYIVCKRWGTI